MNKFSLKKFFSEIFKNKSIILMCVLFSMILWVLTIMFDSKSYSIVTIHDVPVELNTYTTQAEQLGLSFVEIYPKKISVEVRGPRNKIGLITKDDILVAPKSYSNIVTGGNYTLDLYGDLKKKQQDVSVENISHKNIRIKVDIIENKLFNLVSEDCNVKIEPNHIKDEAVCQPLRLYVSGPKESLDKIDVAKLYFEPGEDVLSATKTFDAGLKFLNKEGVEIDKKMFKYSDVKFSVTIPVYNVKQVPFRIFFKNQPDCLSKNILNPIINPPVVDVAGTEEVIKNINEINLGFIDLTELTEEKTNFSLSLTLPPGLKNLTQINSATVSFPKDKLCSKVFDVKGVELINVPEGYDVVVNNKTIKGVKVVGFKDYMENLTPFDLTATADLSNVNLKSGVWQNVFVNIGVINKDGVWPTGKYKCSISATSKK